MIAAGAFSLPEKKTINSQHIPGKRFRPWVIPAFLALGAAFYLQYRYNLFLDDDYLFSSFTGSDRPIMSVRDALYSQTVAYMECNGRFVVHTIVHLFCSIWGRAIFSVVNTLVFLLFFWFMLRLTITGKKQLFVKAFLLVAVIWLFVPVQGIAFLGNIAFSVNYLWVSVVNLGFILLYQRKTKETSRWWQSVLLLIFSLFAGSLQESFSVGIAGALLLYYGFHRKELKGQRLYLVLGYWLGTLIIVGAPGNFIRMLDNQGPLVHSSLKMLILTKWDYLKDIAFSVPVLTLLLVTLVLMFIRHKRSAIGFVKKNQIYLTAIAINLIFALVIAYMGPWQIIISALFTIIMLARPAFEKWEQLHVKYQAVILSAVAVFMITTYVSALEIRKELFTEHEALVQAARTTRTGIIQADYEVTGRAFQKRYRFMENYFRVVFYMGDSTHKHLLSVYLTKGKNPGLVKCVLPFSPKKAESFCTEEHRLLPSVPLFKADAQQSFYIVKANSAAEICSCLAKLNKYLGRPDLKSAPGHRDCEVYRFRGHYYALVYDRFAGIRNTDM